MQPPVLFKTYDFLSGGGEMGKLIRSVDWSRTAIGAVDGWPQSLRTAISIMLNAQFPMYIAWGAEFIQFYNDGYRPILGSTKHPAAMGISTKVTFAEIWDIIGPMFEGVMDGKAVGFTDFLLPLDRHGFTEECYFIFSYSPIKQEDGLTGGVLVAVTETTERLLGERRLKTLREVGDRSSKSKNISDASRFILEAIATNKQDIPFSVLYLYDPHEKVYQYAGSTGIVRDKSDSPDIRKVTALAFDSSPMTATPIRELFYTVVYDEGLPWPELPQFLCVMALTRPEQKNPFGILVAGISARLRYDHHYSNFFKLLTDQAVTALSNANAFEEERKRAEALAEIDRAKTAFFSNVSHEFRTPLTLMLGPLEELLQGKGALDNHQRSNAEAAHRNAVRLLRLVNTLLDFSRIEAGRIEAVFRPVDLFSFTKDLTSNFQSVVDTAGLKLKIEGERLGELAYIDYAMWEKIVLNLLSNAFKYTLKGSITVSVGQTGEWFTLSVADTGIGIPKQELPHMFERFHRISNAAGRSHEGTGIGLSLVYELVKLHGGMISVDSSPGEGSVFTVSLPKGFRHLPADKVVHESDKLYSYVLTESYLKEAASVLSQDVYPNADQPSLENQGKRKEACVLIVDDNADMRNYLIRILESGYHVMTASNGLQALDRIARVVPDLVVSDIMMPVMDGVELLKRIKGNHDTAHIPVMLLSARAGEESKIEGYEVGADDYLVKPFAARELLARVRSQIQLARKRSHLNNLLTHVFEQTPAAITIIRREHYRVEFANDLYLQLVDKDHRFIGRSLFESLPEIENQGVRTLLDRVMNTGVPYQGEEVELFINRQGRRDKTYFNFIYHPLREQDQSISGVIVVCFEVTDLVVARKRAQESEVLLDAKVKERTAELESKNDELKQQKDFIETIFNSSEDIMAVFDKELRFLMVNRKFEEMYHVRKEEIYGRGVQEVFPGSVNSILLDFIKSACRGVSRYTHDYLSNITKRLYELYALPLKHNDDVYAVLAVAHDNTDVIESAKKLEEKNRQLQRVNQELEQFAYVASHDLQEPLRKIRIFSSMLEKNFVQPDEARKYFDKIHLASDRMSRLIKDVLNYSRLSSNDVAFELVDLRQIFESVVSDFDLLIEEKKATVRSYGLPVVRGVPLQLHQLFSNLLSNALKFSSRAPEIQVTAREVSGDDLDTVQIAGSHKSHVLIIFSDNGIGFDPKFSEQIFTIFQRLHDKETPGTVIGLALCKKIVENHGGAIRVESTPGVGSTFFIYLPLE